MIEKKMHKCEQREGLKLNCLFKMRGIDVIV